MKRITSIFAKLALLFGVLTAHAEDITVVITPVQQILPPQALLYVANPGNYFNITLINSSAETKNVYLGMSVEQTSPSNSLSVSIPANRQPQQPIAVGPGQSRQLSLVEMKTLFNHVPMNEVKATPGLFDSYNNGSFGLLPEGIYKAQVIAYQWNPTLATPVALSSPSAGICNFTVCYKAQSPEFLTPMAQLGVATLSTQTPFFTWKQPIVTCNPAAVNFTYTFRMVEMIPNQQPDVAIKNNAVFYEVKDLMTPMVTIPFNFVSRLDKDKTYAVQVTAKATGTGANQLNYVDIENDGKSNILMVKITSSKVDIPVVEEEEEPEPTNPGDADADDEFSSAFGGEGFKALYNFKQPAIIRPIFEKDVARKLYVGDDIDIEWRRVLFIGGEGEMEDTLDFSYNVQLYTNENADIEETLKTTPIYQTTTKDLESTISWDKIKEDVKAGSYMVLRIEPVCKGEESIDYEKDDKSNIIDFAFVDHLSKRYFQCSSVSILGEPTPTELSEKDIIANSKNGTMAYYIGDYKITFDQLTKNKGKDSYSGKGHVLWEPMGYKINIAVKFDEICINDAGVVYSGTATTYPEEEKAKMSNYECVEKLFSDWGVDNLFGDVDLPYAETITKYAGDQVKKTVAEKIDISTYYSYIKKGEAVVDQFLRGEIDDLHFPLSLPKSINKTPCDIQIATMKFSADQATMDVLAEFTMPESKYLKNEILLLGAPRLCISPDNVLPESGTFALLGDFTIVDPDSKFEFTFNAPKDVINPIDGTFISWSEGTLELLDIDVSMKIPKLKKVGKDGKVTQENPTLNFHASIGSWDDWFAECSMDEFTTDDTKGWSFQPGKDIIYDHSVYRNGKNMGKFPEGYNKVDAGMSSEGAPDTEWQGLYVSEVKVIFPGMLDISDKSKLKEGEAEVLDDGRFCFAAKNMFVDGAGGTGKAAISCRIGLSNIFDLSTGKLGGWGISMDEFMLEITQNAFKKAYFKGTIETPLEGLIGYQCDMYAQGKDADGVTDPNRSAYIFKTQQLEGLNFDFWLASIDFDHDQTYFLVEAERFRDDESKNTTKVELNIGGVMSIDIAERALKKIGVPGKLTAYLPGIKISGLRLANCERWKSAYTQNQYEDPSKQGGGGISLNGFFGWKEEYNIKKDEFYFSLGRWSLSLGGGGGMAYHMFDKDETYTDRWYLAQADVTPVDMGHGPSAMTAYVSGIDLVTEEEAGKGKVSAFDFNVKKFDFKYEKNVATLTVGGDISLMGGALSCGCTLDLLADVDIDNMSFKARKPKFNEAHFNSSFGCVVFEGTLNAVDTNDDDGYKGTITLHVGELFKLDIEGLYANHEDGGKKIAWGYFESKVAGEGLHFDPIVLKGIEGGFYINCNVEKTYQKSCYGGKFGLTVASSGDAITGDMNLTFIYDGENKCVSSIVLVGSIKAMMGMVKGDAKIAYNDVPKKERTFELDVTVTASTDLGAAVQKAVEEKLGVFNAKYKDMMAKVKELPGGSLAAMGQDDEASDDAEKLSGDEKKASGDGSQKQHIGGASVKVNFNLKVTKPYGKSVKWHAYFGRPNNRCEFTFIDFLVGSKDIGGFGAWCYMGVNGYLCMGNELPEEGMPDPPQEVMDYLYGSKNEKTLDTGAGTKSQLNTAKDNVAKAFKAANEAGGSGGFMFGLHGKADFGVNAGLVYCNGLLMAGLDMMVKKYKDGTHCADGRSMGKNGWYGLGQMYIMVQGELGVQINLWFFKGRCSLIKAGFGALLQGGAPNPAWAYGKVKAHCELLGGLFKFNKSVELKAGRVCVPDYGDPLDNLDLFAECEPGKEDDNNYSETDVSPDLWPKFTTNFTMDTQSRLLDEGKGYERSYMFKVVQVDLICESNSKYNQKNLTTTTLDHVSFNVGCAPLEPNSKYKLYLKGRAYEYNVSRGKWDDPIIDGKRQVKTDEATYYFKTGNLKPNVTDYIALSSIGTNYQSQVRRDDAAYPYLSLKRNRDDLLRDYDYYWILFKNGKYVYGTPVVAKNTASSSVWGIGDKNLRFVNSTTSENLKKQYIGTGTSNDYRWAIYRFDKGKGAAEIKGLFQKTDFSDDVSKKVNSKKEAYSNQKGVSAYANKVQSNTYFGATNDAAGEINNFFAKEENEKKNEKNTIETTSQRMQDYTYAEFQTGVMDWYSEFDNITSATFKNYSGANGLMPYERVFFNFDYIAFNSVSGNNKYRDMFYGSDYWNLNFTDEKAYNASAWEKSPYWTIGYLTKFLFLGGMPVNKYHFDTSIGKRSKNLEVTFPNQGKAKVWTDGDITFPEGHNQKNPKGLTIKTQYPELRSGDSPITTFDGLFGSLSNSSFNMIPAFNLYSGDTKKVAIAMYGSSVMVWADIFAKAVPYRPRWDGHSYMLSKTKTEDQLNNLGYWATTAMEVQSWEKNLKYSQDLRVVRQFREATLSDAYGMYKLTEQINSVAKNCETIFSLCGYLSSKWYEDMGLKGGERAEAAGGIVSYINFDETGTLSIGGYSKNYTISKYTDVNGSTYKGTFTTLKGSDLEVRHFYNAMIAANKVKGLSIIYDSAYNKYDKRRGLPNTCWNNMKNFTFDYQDYLNSIGKVAFEGWKATYYDFSKSPGYYRLDYDMKSTNVRSIQILNPFSGVTVN